MKATNVLRSVYSPAHTVHTAGVGVGAGVVPAAGPLGSLEGSADHALKGLVPIWGRGPGHRGTLSPKSQTGL